jgi:hypothetical protein
MREWAEREVVSGRVPLGIMGVTSSLGGNGKSPLMREWERRNKET